MLVVTIVPTNITETTAICGGTITADSEVVTDYYPIVDRLIKNKFQLYNRSRQKIVSTIHNPIPLKPFQMFTDREQSAKPFVLCAYRYKPDSDEYEVELFEYDNTSVIDLVDITVTTPTP